MYVESSQRISDWRALWKRRAFPGFDEEEAPYTCEREKEEKDVVVSTFLLSARLLRFLERHPWRRGVTRERVVLAASIVIDF